ncbi:MAG TPA: PfkB family carbohydrate kinase [Elusimicrobiales bacterium]|nr:PfkB family carbohydrate kinase [Elusimicrobiales bacterium]
MIPTRVGSPGGHKKSIPSGSVLVLNLNFSVDKTAQVPAFEKGRVYRLARTLTLPGGKGVNVIRALRELGVAAPVSGFASGHNGRWIEQALKANKFEAFVEKHSAGESRMCLTVVDGAGASMDFNEEGPAVPPGAQRRFLAAYRRALRPGPVIAALCGRTPAGLKKGFYAALVRAAAARGCFTAVDASGPALAEALGAGAEGIKINRDEFAELSGAPFSPAGFYSFFKKRQACGLQTLIVTGGAAPAYAASPFGLWRITPPRLARLKSPVGAGDSFMAGFVCGFVRGYDFERTLRLAGGAAASDCLSLGAGFIDRAEALAFSRKVLVKKIKSS